MAKKSLKHLSKPANTANLSNTPTLPTPATAVTEDTAPVTPSASPSAHTSSPAPYKPITDDASIERLVGLAKESPPNSALGIVWNYAYDEAYQKGRLEVLQNLGKKLEEKFKEGKKEGIKEGKDLHYGRGIVRGECDEHERWKAAGHSKQCFAAFMPVAILESTGTQTDSPATTTTSIFTQTDTLDILTTSISIQTESSIPLYLENDSSNIKNAKISQASTTNDNKSEILLFFRRQHPP